MFQFISHYLSDLQSWHGFTFIIIAYVAYYLLEAVKRPVLACSDGPFKDFLLKKIPTLEKKYWPTFWCIESRAQTILATLLRSQTIPNINYRREILTLKDGGEVALDWMEEYCADDAPCIIILPGLTGESQEEYVKCLVLAGNNARMRVVVFNNRGLGGIQLKTPRLYSAANYDDLVEVIRHVRKCLPHVKLGATGISMGGLVLGNYLAREGEEARKLLSAAKIISVPWDVHKSIANIEKPYLNNFLGRHLASNLYRTVSNLEMFKNSDIDWEQMKACKTIREFDSFFTIKRFGYAHVDDYYNDATLHNKLHHISVPLLCLSAADDPFQPLDAIPVKAAEECSHVAIVITARGGHIGFLEGFWPSKRDQYMGRVFAEFFTNALFDNDGEFQRTAKQLDENLKIKQI